MQSNRGSRNAAMKVAVLLLIAVRQSSQLASGPISDVRRVIGQKVDSCRATFPDGSSLDLSPLDGLNGTGGQPKFANFHVVFIAGVGYSLNYNPCSGFACNTDKSAAVCAKDIYGFGVMYDIASQVNDDIYLANGSAQIRYTSVDKGQGRDFVTIVTLVCTSDPPSITEVVLTLENQLTFRLNSPESCLMVPPRAQSGWSPGDIILLIAGLAVLLYFFGFLLINAFVLKQSGLDLLPHRHAWSYLALLIKDGFVFTFVNLRAKLCKRDGYSEV